MYPLSTAFYEGDTATESSFKITTTVMNCLLEDDTGFQLAEV
jgi:hypothetical protein